MTSRRKSKFKKNARYESAREGGGGGEFLAEFFEFFFEIFQELFKSKQWGALFTLIGIGVVIALFMGFDGCEGPGSSAYYRPVGSTTSKYDVGEMGEPKVSSDNIQEEQFERIGTLIRKEPDLNLLIIETDQSVEIKVGDKVNFKDSYHPDSPIELSATVVDVDGRGASLRPDQPLTSYTPGMIVVRVTR